MPLTTFQRRVAGSTDVSAVFVSAAEGQNMSEVRERIETLMRERRRVAPGAADDFSVRDMQELAQALTAVTGSLTALLGAIAAVSLLVGGIGIMNIMLVSVTERTREIGIRIAIGALGADVMLQFLVESMVLSLLGGITGVAAGILGAFLVSRGMDLPFVLRPQTVALAFAVSAGIGVVFGFLPARKAARMEPIEALRHE
jgi:putative ABC transport system permease protein